MYTKMLKQKSDKMDKRGQMIFSNFMSVLFVVIIFVAIFFITYSVFKIKSTLSGPMSFKSIIDFKNSFTNIFLFSKSLEYLNVQNSKWVNDDNITTLETLMMINIINSTDGKGFYLYDNLDGPTLDLFNKFEPMAKRFYFVYPTSNKYFGKNDWNVIEDEEKLCKYNYDTSQGQIDCSKLFPKSIDDFVNYYLHDSYGFQSFEFPIFFRRFRGYIFISNYINVPITAAP